MTDVEIEFTDATLFAFSEAAPHAYVSFVLSSHAHLFRPLWGYVFEDTNANPTDPTDRH